MIRKALLLLVPAALGLLITSQWPDIRRYLKIRQLSQGNGRPQNIPLKGTKAYSRGSDDGEQDGAGELNSASREEQAKRP